MSEEEIHRSQELMEQVGALVSNKSSLDIMVVFSWILGDMIVQTGSDSSDVMADFIVMVKTAVEILTTDDQEGAPDGIMLN